MAGRGGSELCPLLHRPQLRDTLQRRLYSEARRRSAKQVKDTAISFLFADSKKTLVCQQGEGGAGGNNVHPRNSLCGARAFDYVPSSTLVVHAWRPVPRDTGCGAAF